MTEYIRIRIRWSKYYSLTSGSDDGDGGASDGNDNLQKVIVMERLMSPPKSAVQKLLPVPPGLNSIMSTVGESVDHDGEIGMVIKTMACL